MPRILFTSTLGASAWAGSEVLWYQAAQRLAAEGHEVAAVLPTQMQGPATLDRLASAGIRPLHHPLDAALALGVRLARRRKPAAPTSLAPVVRHARQWKADMVVLSQASCWGAYSEMLALAEAGIPYVSISQLNTPFSWPGDKLYEAVGESFARAKAAVFVSRGNLDLFQNQVARQLGNAHVIYNPPSFDVSVPCGPPPEGVFRLLNVARIDPGHKGQDLLLDVLAMPKWRERQVELEIAGGGNRRWIERLIQSKELENVRLLGHVSDLQEAWERATFGVFPSRYEGMPLAMIEGMALGRAVIATDVAAHAEWIEKGRNGFLAVGTTASLLDAAMEEAWLIRGQAATLGCEASESYRRLMPRKPHMELASLILSDIS
jgi:glycosyltransferase involved in cell wall biosynthesis